MQSIINKNCLIYTHKTLLHSGVSLYYFGAKAKQGGQQGEQKEFKKMDKTSEYLLQKFREKKDKYAVTKDNYRIDIGLVLERLPIFKQVDMKEIEHQKFRRYLQNKYKLKFEIPKELGEYQEQHPTADFDSHDTDNLISHQNPETKAIYHKHSKLFKNTDPNIKDPHSIQYASNYSVYLLVKTGGLWHFPYLSMMERQSLTESVGELIHKVENNVLNTYQSLLSPIVSEVRQFNSELKEDQDPRNKGLQGVKCFYFSSLHVSGNVENAIQNQYQDYAWVPRRQLQNYLTQQQYEDIVHVVTE